MGEMYKNIANACHALWERELNREYLKGYKAITILHGCSEFLACSYFLVVGHKTVGRIIGNLAAGGYRDQETLSSTFGIAFLGYLAIDGLVTVVKGERAFHLTSSILEKLGVPKRFPFPRVSDLEKIVEAEERGNPYVGQS